MVFGDKKNHVHIVLTIIIFVPNFHVLFEFNILGNRV